MQGLFASSGQSLQETSGGRDRKVRGWKMSSQIKFGMNLALSERGNSTSKPCLHASNQDKC